MAQNKIISEVVRSALLLHPQGLTVRELAKLTGYAQDLLISCLRRTYGCYIADYVISSTGARQFNAVWRCVPVPFNITKPLASSFPVEVVDDRQAEESKRRKIRKGELLIERAQQKAANERIKEAAKKHVKEAVKTKPTPSVYKPEKTVWVTVPPWSH